MTPMLRRVHRHNSRRRDIESRVSVGYLMRARLSRYLGRKAVSRSDKNTCHCSCGIHAAFVSKAFDSR